MGRSYDKSTPFISAFRAPITTCPAPITTYQDSRRSAIIVSCCKRYMVLYISLYVALCFFSGLI